jgi:hypothetical protein
MEVINLFAQSNGDVLLKYGWFWQKPHF